ncbi:MAG: dehydrogenase, partial [Opitutaceae bacterium]
MPLSGAARLEVDRGTMRDRTANEGGVSNHVVDSAAGITVYRGGAYPPEFYGSHFVGDGVANVVHRRVVIPQGASFRTVRGDPGAEFARTPDNWFRPVNFVNAPDGTLYCIDMGREHSESINIPPDVEKHLDLTGGSGRGRIYRMAPAGFTAPPPPRLGSASTAELVQALDSP